MRNRSSSPRKRKCGSTPPSTSIRKSCVKHDFLKIAARTRQRRFFANSKRNTASDAEFLVDGMGYLTALAKTGLLGDLTYSDRNIVEKLFQTCTMRVGRFHEAWNGSQPALNAWLTAYTASYNRLRSHQALENQTPIEALELENS